VDLLGRRGRIERAGFLVGRDEAKGLLKKLRSILATRAVVACGLDLGFAPVKESTFSPLSPIPLVFPRFFASLRSSHFFSCGSIRILDQSRPKSG
jgi:hypothetical protein